MLIVEIWLREQKEGSWIVGIGGMVYVDTRGADVELVLRVLVAIVIVEVLGILII